MAVFLLVAAASFLATSGYTPHPARTQTVTDPVTTIPVTVMVDAFELGSTEVTQAAYAELMGRNPSANRGGDGKLPVENVTWLDAVRFANALSVKQGYEACYDGDTGRRVFQPCRGFRLPTEAEWSYALERAPAGSREAANLGLPSVKDANALLPLKTRPVDATNGDLIGNVWEWCEDWFANDLSPWPLHNPRGPLRGLERVIRGGSFRTSRTSWQRALRSSMDPAKASPHTGFRLARSLNVERSVRTVAPSFAKNVESNWFDARLENLGGDQKILLMDGAPDTPGKRPVVLVPYYDVDTPAGLNLGGRAFQQIPQLWFARQAAQAGFVAVAVRWYGEGAGEWYDEAVANVTAKGLTGMDRWVADSRRVLDRVLRLPNVDPKRMAMFGHSLGGKMTMYAMAADARIGFGIVSDPGLPPESTNYGDYWYLGEAKAKGLDHHALMQKIAPRPFLLLAGETDTEASKAYLKEGAEWIHHGKGHRPPAEVVGEAWVWLLRKLT